MKKSTFLKSALTVIAALTIGSAYAQSIVDVPANYTEDEGTAVYQTVGNAFRLYVEKDPNYGGGANSQWTFTTTLPLAYGTSGTAMAQNWVEITAAAAVGAYTVSVVEGNTLIGCTDATPVVTNINIVAAPTATIETADVTNWCGSQGAQTVTIKITENVPDAYAAYAFSLTEVVEELDVDDNVTATPTASHTVVDHTLASKLSLTGTPNFSTTYTTPAIVVSNDKRTRYTYTLHKATDANAGTAEGIISAISQKSEIVAGTQTAFAFTDNQVVFIVNPIPVTGPIYHIPNNFNI